MRHLQPKYPSGSGVFSYGRVPAGVGDRADGVTYRLFRKSTVTGRTFMEARTFGRHVSRADLARIVWRMRVALRDTVDDVDLALMHITEKAAA